MYISRLRISNFRNFKDFSITFNDGLNVLIGHNNAGKTNLLKAIGLIFNRQSPKRLEIDDFNKSVSDFSTPPKITIEAFISESSDMAKERNDDLSLVATWLIKIKSPYEAKVTYEYYLPDANLKEYQDSVALLNQNGAVDPVEYWNNIKSHFLRKYISRIYCGNNQLRNRIEPENLDKFDFQFLDAIRDVEKQLFSGGNATLKEILNYFLDDKIHRDTTLSKEERRDRINQLKKVFKSSSAELIKSLAERVDTYAILQYASDTGASVGGNPTFEGEIGEAELLSALKLIISDKTGMRLPATHNGLGYNNLVFMALLLAKMQMNCSSYNGEDNSKVFPMLLIEEPEAHLHPSLQYKFLKFLKLNINKQQQVRQVFVTSHSTSITAAVNLDELICINVNTQGEPTASYPGKVFNPEPASEFVSKAYIERFLDATKSDMLFSRSVVFVEGVAEQLLMHCFAAYEGKSFEDTHTSVINVGGSTFKHFIKLFDYDSQNPYKSNAISKKVACVVDVDPCQKIGSSWNGCYPFEITPSSPDFRSTSPVIENLQSGIAANVRICYNDSGKGKTLEYDLAFENPSCELLVTNVIAAKNQQICRMLMQGYTSLPFEQLEQIPGVNATISEKIAATDWNEEHKKRALIAAHYLKAVEFLKGEHAMALEKALRMNLEQANPHPFNLPEYIKTAIHWVS